MHPVLQWSSKAHDFIKIDERERKKKKNSNNIYLFYSVEFDVSTNQQELMRKTIEEKKQQ